MIYQSLKDHTTGTELKAGMKWGYTGRFGAWYVGVNRVGDFSRLVLRSSFRLTPRFSFNPSSALSVRADRWKSPVIWVNC
jgi:hypothetical protein